MEDVDIERSSSSDESAIDTTSCEFCAAGGSKEEGESSSLTPTEAAIIEYLKKTNLSNPNAAASMLQEMSEEEQHKFWDTQPMMPHDSTSGTRDEGPMVANEDVKVRETPYHTPSGFCWANVDVTDQKQLQELYDLLYGNYVEDDDALFRFDYSKDFLNWALTPPGSRSEWCLGVRTTSKSKKLVGFISAVPASVRVKAHSSVKMVEINFLCVHKKLRSKRLAPVLIKEITRRVNASGVFQAVYTAGVVLPVPISAARYWHRSLNPKKLIDVGFSRLPPRTTMARHCKRYKLPSTPRFEELRPMTKEDVPGVHELLTNYLESKTKLHINFTPDEIEHWLLPREGVVHSYVTPDSNGKITDFCSFYQLPSTILNHNDTLFAAYSFYNVATTMDLASLMRDCLVMAKECGMDVFNCLELMENEVFFDELKFGKGDGLLQYYLYNWSYGQKMDSQDVGIVLL